MNSGATKHRVLMKIFIWWRDLQFLHFDEFLEAQDQLFDSSPRTPQELRIATIFKPIISMSWKFSGRLYLKSVQTCDKSVGRLSWTLLFGVLAWKIRPVSDSIIFWGQSWRYLDYWRIFTNSLRVELHSILAFHNVGESFIFYGLGKASSSKTYFPRPSVVNQLNTIDTNLALLGNSMFILVLLSGFSILMGRMHILGT